MGTLTIAALVTSSGCGARIRVDASGEDGDFTTADGENQIELLARRPRGWRSAEIRWEVERGVAGEWERIEVAPGPETIIEVTTPSSTARYRGRDSTTASWQARQFERQRLQYRVVAVAENNGAELRSDTLQLGQNLVAAIRQEYLDIGLRRGAVPPEWLTSLSSAPAADRNGDFDIAAVNPEFMERFEQLERIWKDDYELEWDVNSFYRNPAHNRFHIGGSGSGPVSNSWHQFGCAADFQTYPILSSNSRRRDTLRAREFWNALAEEAMLLGFEVEPRDKNPNRSRSSYSGVGHVHIELDCPP